MFVKPGHIPRPALWLGLAGILPFVIGTRLSFAPYPTPLHEGHYAIFFPSDGFALVFAYGKLILSFMSGCLWGFATRSETHHWRNYGLSVLPALYVFIFVSGSDDEQLFRLGVGFIAILALDAAYMRWRLAPHWWLTLRVMITIIVVTLFMIASANLP